MKRNILTVTLLLLCNFLSVNSFSQEWSALGPDDASSETGLADGQATYLSVAADPAGVPYVAYADNNNEYKVTVKRFVNNQWENVGAPGFTGSLTGRLTFIVDHSGVPYVAYTESVPTTSMYPIYRATVKKYTDGQWKNVGEFPYPDGQAQDMAINVDQNDVPYVVYNVMPRGNNTRMIQMVHKYINGNWQQINQRLPGNAALDNNIAVLKDGKVYLCYKDQMTGKATLAEVNGQQWKVLAESNGFAYNVRMALDKNDVPYVVYMDINSNSKATVKKFVNGQFEAVGPAGFSSSAATGLSIAIGTDDKPYVFSGNAVMKFNGESWKSFGPEQFSAKEIASTSIFTNEKKIYIAYITMKRVSSGNDDPMYGGGGMPSYTTYMYPYVKYSSFGPDAPQNLQAKAGDARVELKWDNLNEAVSYKIYKGTTSANLVEFKTITTPGYVDLEVQNGITYYYAVTATDAGGAESGKTASKSAKPLAAPNITVPADVVAIIVDGTYMISDPPSNSTGAFSYTSSDPAVATISGNVVNLLAKGETIITVTQAASGGYSAGNITFKLTVINDPNKAPTINSVSNQLICTGVGEQRIALSNITAGPESNQVVGVSVSTDHPELFNVLNVSKGTGDDGILSYVPVAGMSGEAVITLKVKDDGGIANGGTDTYTTSFILTISALPVASISADLGLSISKGQTVKLTATGGTLYSWGSASGIISGQNTSVLTVRPDQTTTYEVTVTNANGCSVTRQVTITVKADLQAVVVSNIMTPNGDGANDNFMITNIDMFPTAVLKVYDSVGRLIYTQSNYDNSWNGYVNGELLATGGYMYVVTFSGITPALPALRGYVNIINK